MPAGGKKNGAKKTADSREPAVRFSGRLIDWN